MLEKTYDPAAIEAKHYAAWESAGAFASDVTSNRRPYCIMMPPPNVTGSLHMGHALTFTLQDVLIRYWRMRGRDALWQPGTDHAGIATQMVVERELAKQHVTRQQLGREKFVEKVWAWKAESGGTITRQLRRLGASADWPRERFTLDEGLSAAVRKVFVELYRRKLLYKDKRLVNWDPKLHTAISDLEVEQKEIKGQLWHFKYPVEGEPERFIVVATTRPETMLGDTAVAVHPGDGRYRALVGRHAVLPLVGRRIPIVADDYADPETGSGAVKITPAHDFNDFEVGKRHKLEMVNIFDRDARTNDNVPEPYRGLDRYDARKKVVADLEAQGLVEKIEAHTHMVPHGDRSGVAIEPWLTDQWYVDAATLARPAIEAVEQGRTVFVPEHWTKTYYDWMRNIQPWCVSRQLWWGHQIPAWYGPDGAVFVEEGEAAARAASLKHYGKEVALERDPDVLDTWFSSGLWPFSTLGWPENTPELRRYYPGDVLVTGFDIIFFWVARMMMLGIHFMGDVPFRQVYIHALVRDERGQKMSKSKGNIIDPLEVIDRYGCDALRFTFAQLATPGRDIKLATSRVEGNRNFATKLWNAARFAQMNQCAPVADFDPGANRQTVNRWIVGESVAVARRVGQAIETYRFDEAAAALYQFVWGTFCDWYLEFTKPILGGTDAAAAAETRATTAWVIRRILRLLHPVMPFVTEELAAQFALPGDRALIREPWPEDPDGLLDAAASAEMGWVVRVIEEVRSIRAQYNVEPGKALVATLVHAAPETGKRLDAHRELILRLGRLERIDLAAAAGKGVIESVIDEATLALSIAAAIDKQAELKRLGKELDKVAGEAGKLKAKLDNPGFIAKAPPEVVDDIRERLSEAETVRTRLSEARERLAAL
ncbi:MAG: valine--tRNA ligase [Alphaproteobacteria bacterium]|nr:valine--tRNA ligase [Alphaproteobacteria bacterium]